MSATLTCAVKLLNERDTMMNIATKDVRKATRLWLRIATVCVALGFGSVEAASPPPPALSEFPLVWSDQVIPNFLITLDDSRSMNWGFLPDTLQRDIPKLVNGAGVPILDALGREQSDYANTLRVHSSDHNAVAYNPSLIYRPPRRPDGTLYPPANYNAALVDGFEPFMTTAPAPSRRVDGHNSVSMTTETGSPTVNLATSYRMTWQYPVKFATTIINYNRFANAPAPAFYSVKKPGATIVPGVGRCDSISNGNAYWTLISDAQSNSGTSAASRARLNAYDSGCFTRVNVSAGEAQNFANWYSYYRTRILGAISGLVTAVASTSSDVRMSCQGLANTLAGACNTTIEPLAVMDPAGRQSLINRIINTPTPGDTPLREAALRAHYYFDGNTSANGPWAFNPALGVKAPEYSCRQSYHMIVTDGAWSGTQGVSIAGYPAASDQDNTGALARPYRDTTNPSNEITLADIALFSWSKDMRPGLPPTGLDNNVPKRIAVPNANPAIENDDPSNDPAKHQHLSTFTVGFGINGALNYPADTFNLKVGVKNWTGVWKNDSLGNRIPDVDGRVDDLWHAAINGRGKYFSASNPAILATSIQSIVDLVTKGTATGASASGSSSVGSDNTAVYIANYTGGTWSGDLKAYRVLNGVVQTTPTWSAADQLNTYAGGYASRKIFAREGNTTYSFNFASASMSTATKNLFNRPLGSAVDDGKGADRVNYIRGDRSKELSLGGEFRNRTSALGDIVNSSATFVGPPNATYDNGTHPGYSAYASTQAGRKKMLYFGANDGMLHGLDAANGEELFAFIPGAVLAKTRLLPEVAYAHKTFVDASPIAADLNVGGWKTMLFAPFGTGAKGLFALNVTNPTTVTHSNSLWELTPSATPNIADALGYITGVPQRHPVTGQPRNIGKFSSTGAGGGSWAAFFPNGYNSDADENGVRGSGNASLIVVDYTGSANGSISAWGDGVNVHVIPTDTAGDGPYNGLSMPTGVDINGDGKIDVLYAGDLKGNLWKFEMTDRSVAGMPSKAVGTIKGKRIFRAVNASGQPQPITVAPAVLRNGDGKYIVIFGTGRLLTTDDKTRPPTGFPIQSLYGVHDDDGATEITRSDLFAQRIIPPYTPVKRLVEPVTGQTGTKRGWRLDLDSNLGQDEGERVISNPLLLPGGAVVFATAAPSIDACTQAGTGWTMLLDGLTGGRLDIATFDLNRNGNTLDDYTMVSGKKVYASGMQSEVGVSPTPLALATGSTIQLVTGGASRGWSSAQVSIKTPMFDANGRPLYGRISWQQIGR